MRFTIINMPHERSQLPSWEKKAVNPTGIIMGVKKHIIFEAKREERPSIRS